MTRITYHIEAKPRPQAYHDMGMERNRDCGLIFNDNDNNNNVKYYIIIIV